MLTGGISNHLFGFYEEGKFEADVVLFRIDAEGKDLLVDTDREKRNMQVKLKIIVYHSHCHCMSLI